MSASKCRPVQYSDTTECLTCGLKWDTNDPDPPPCGANKPVDPHRLAAKLERCKGSLTHFRYVLSDAEIDCIAAKLRHRCLSSIIRGWFGL